MDNNHAKKKTCYFSTYMRKQNQKSNRSAFGNLMKLRMQQHQCQMNHGPNRSQREDIRKQMKDNLVINVMNFHNLDLLSYGKMVYSGRVNNKIIAPTKKNDFVQKCRLTTEQFDELKGEVTNKIRIKKTKSRDSHFRRSIFAGKENQRFHSCEDMKKQSQQNSYRRYNDISVSEFFELDESAVGGNMAKRFYEMRGESNKNHNRPRANTE